MSTVKLKTVKEYIKEGNRLQNEGDLQGAIAHYHLAIDLDANAAKAYHALGNVLIREGKNEEAINKFKKAIEIQPDLASSHHKLGELFLRSGNIEKALAHSQKTVLLDSNNWKFQLVFAKASLKANNKEKAIEAFSKVTELNPNCSEAFNQINLILDKNKKAEKENSKNKIDLFDRTKFQEKLTSSHLNILFLLPVSGGSGGAHSVVQECLALYRHGIDVRIAVNQSNYNKFLITYSDISEINQILVCYQTLTDIKNIAKNFLVVCATVYNSVNILEKIVQEDNSIIPAYYIQDYEILFSQKDTPEWLEAWNSYTLIPHAVLFAKTHWLCEVISKNHNVIVHKVEPSIDHDVYYPNLAIDNQSDLVKICAMIRFSTPRRAAKRTLSVINEIGKIFGKKVHFTLFGSNPGEIEASGLPIPNNSNVLNRLTRPEVAEVLRNSDIFLDLSDYQAFGRTGLEAMACGCIPVLPQKGGTNEYAISDVNSKVVETTNINNCIANISELIKYDLKKKYKIKINGIATSSNFNTKKSAFSILNLLLDKAYENLD